MKIVEFWAKGYADRDGTSRLTIEDHADPADAVRRAVGGCAKVYSVRPAIPAPAPPPVSDAYARMMSQHDNS